MVTLRLIPWMVRLKPRFVSLAAHYVFEPVLAPRAAGNEKGLVEGLVGYCWRNHLVPPPVVGRWQELNAMVKARLLAEWERAVRDHGGQTVGQPLEAKRRRLLRLPDRSYRAGTSHSVAATRQALDRHPGARVSVPAAPSGRVLRLEAYHDRAEL